MFMFYLLCYAAVLIKFTYYAQEKELCLVCFHCLYANLHELIADSLEIWCVNRAIIGYI